MFFFCQVYFFCYVLLTENLCSFICFFPLWFIEYLCIFGVLIFWLLHIFGNSFQPVVYSVCCWVVFCSLEISSVISALWLQSFVLWMPSLLRDYKTILPIFSSNTFMGFCVVFKNVYVLNPSGIDVCCELGL